MPPGSVIPAKGIFARIHPNPMGTRSKGSKPFRIARYNIKMPTPTMNKRPIPSVHFPVRGKRYPKIPVDLVKFVNISPMGATESWVGAVVAGKLPARARADIPRTTIKIKPSVNGLFLISDPPR
jgi:hypothetical protein